MSSELLHKTVITDNWQIFSNKLFQHFIHHKNILKITQKLNLKSFVVQVFSTKIYPWYTAPPPPPTPAPPPPPQSRPLSLPGANRVKLKLEVHCL